MKTLLLKLTITTSLIITSSIANAVGVGISFDSTGAEIYMPFDISDKLRVEPVISYRNSDNESTYYEPEDLTSPSSAPIEKDYSNNRTSKMTTIGVGIFTNKEVTNNIKLFYGARVGFLEQSIKDADTYYYSSAIETRVINSDLDGFVIAPTLLVEYMLSEKISIGGEMSIDRYDLDGDSSSYQSYDSGPDGNLDAEQISKGSVSSTETATSTSVSLRFYY